MNQPTHGAPSPTRAALRHVITHLLVPLFLGTGMALAYLGGFHHPSPHALKVDVVGTGAPTAVLAQRLQDGLGDRVALRTVPTEAAARQQLQRGEIAGAFVPDARAPRLLLATAGSQTTAQVVEAMFAPVAIGQGLPLDVVDVVPLPQQDPTGQGVFFYMVALTVGSYSGAIAIGAAGAALALRCRAALAVATGAVLSVLATVVAGPLYHALPSHTVGLGLLAWLYTSAILLIGVGLHAFLGRLTTAAMVGLFVMLNFTTSGGIFTPALQPGFFAALHSFWIGAGLVEAGRRLLYFPALGISGEVTRLVLWAGAGLALVGAAALRERRRRTPRPTAVTLPADGPSAEAEEEIEETVAA
ncbi:MAG: hypothetical protein JWM48_553 [Mycobacterium sp.]|nr:hypothetical protein [Mycobacterium sp.]